MHIASHDLYNAYQCAICDFADDMEYTLHKHIKTKHDVEKWVLLLVLISRLCVNAGSILIAILLDFLSI